mmetsp:Transcript_50676/g.163683  ORF Transcript_50676/g.163683 Transcript_50676/m.163683 type:complete len:297 (+) Transcript_50676:141-1031(+)
MLVLVSSAPAGLVVPGSAQHRPHRGRSPSPRLTADKPPALGFTFTPGGLLFPYYVGIAYSLKEEGLVSPTTPVGGSSAGSIVAAALACGVEEETVLSGLAALVEDVRSGTRLNPALRKQLDVLMPEDAARLAMEHNLAVGYLRVTPWPKACIVTEWESKADLIDTVCASCNWPFFFSRWPLVWCRGQLALDGFFSVPRSRFGCPPLTGAGGLPPERTVAVCCLPRVSLAAFAARDTIQPERRAEYRLEVPEAQWFSWALEPATDAELAGMVRKGREHARAWLEADSRPQAERRDRN